MTGLTHEQNPNSNNGNPKAHSLRLASEQLGTEGPPYELDPAPGATPEENNYQALAQALQPRANRAGAYLFLPHTSPEHFEVSSLPLGLSAAIGVYAVTASPEVSQAVLEARYGYKRSSQVEAKQVSDHLLATFVEEASWAGDLANPHPALVQRVIEAASRPVFHYDSNRTPKPVTSLLGGVMLAESEEGPIVGTFYKRTFLTDEVGNSIENVKLAYHGTRSRYQKPGQEIAEIMANIPSTEDREATQLFTCHLAKQAIAQYLPRPEQLPEPHLALVA